MCDLWLLKKINSVELESITIATVLSVSFCPYHFVGLGFKMVRTKWHFDQYHLVRSPFLVRWLMFYVKPLCIDAVNNWMNERMNAPFWGACTYYTKQLEIQLSLWLLTRAFCWNELYDEFTGRIYNVQRNTCMIKFINWLSFGFSEMCVQ